MSLRAIAPGPSATVQNGGRFGFREFGVPVSGPFDRVSAAIANALLGNAIDAAVEGSDLTLQTSTLLTGAWRCRLHNGGPAIPPDALARVFEIFFSTKPGGTGIGLALCKRIIEEHGGSITLESSPDSGTTAQIILPPA